MYWVLIAILVCFGLAVVALLFYGSRLPAKWEVIESITIRADREKLFDYLNVIENWEQWTIWSKDINPSFEFKYEGAKSGTGATQCWRANKQFGKTKICSTQRPEKIAFMFQFGHGQQMMKGCLTMLPRGGETEVRWAAYGDAGNNPTRKIMAQMMTPYMKKDFERGLARLKTIMEG
jgi:Polyketide cyclase / dehydrase and lipid transport